MILIKLFGGAIALLSLFFVLVPPTLDWALDTTRDKLSELHFPDTYDKVLPPIPDEDNAFPQLVRATKRFTDFGGMGWEVMNNRPPDVSKLEYAQSETFRKWASDNKDALDSLPLSLDRSGYRPPTNVYLSFPSNDNEYAFCEGEQITGLWLLKTNITLTNTLLMDGIRLTRSGHAETSLKRFITALKLQRYHRLSICSEGDLRGWMETLLFNCDSLSKALSFGLWTGEELAQLQKAFMQAEPPRNFTTILHGEAMQATHYFRFIYQPAFLKALNEGGTGGEIIKKWIDLEIYQGCLSYMLLAQKTTGTHQEIQSTFDSLSLRFLIQNLIFKGLLKDSINQTRKVLTEDVPATRALHGYMLLKIALQRYKLRQGAYPQSLSRLEEEGFCTPPKDPMTGEDFKYTLLPDGRYSLDSPSLLHLGIDPL